MILRNLVSIASILCTGVVCLTPGEALGGSTTLGSDCHVYNYHLSTPPPYQKQTNYINHGVYDDTQDNLLGVTCVLPTETTLGTTVNFRARVNDANPNFGITCYGTVYNQNGDTVVSTSALTTGAAQTGTITLTGSVAVSPQSASYTYGINCTLPTGIATTLQSARVY